MSSQSCGVNIFLRLPPELQNLVMDFGSNELSLYACAPRFRDRKQLTRTISEIRQMRHFSLNEMCRSLIEIFARSLPPVLRKEAITQVVSIVHSPQTTHLVKNERIRLFLARIYTAPQFPSNDFDAAIEQYRHRSPALYHSAQIAKTITSQLEKNDEELKEKCVAYLLQEKGEEARLLRDYYIQRATERGDFHEQNIPHLKSKGWPVQSRSGLLNDRIEDVCREHLAAKQYKEAFRVSRLLPEGSDALWEIRSLIARAGSAWLMKQNREEEQHKAVTEATRWVAAKFKVYGDLCPKKHTKDLKQAALYQLQAGRLEEAFPLLQVIGRLNPKEELECFIPFLPQIVESGHTELADLFKTYMSWAQRIKLWVKSKD